jgi:ABC-type transporter Mla MlaB component
VNVARFHTEKAFEMQSPEKVALSGLLTVGTVGAGRSALLAALERSDAITIEIAPTTAVDVSGLQLIDAARHYAVQLGKSVALAAPAGEKLRELLQTAGFIEGTDADMRAFWLRGEA